MEPTPLTSTPLQGETIERREPQSRNLLPTPLPQASGMTLTGRGRAFVDSLHNLFRVEPNIPTDSLDLEVILQNWRGGGDAANVEAAKEEFRRFMRDENYTELDLSDKGLKSLPDFWEIPEFARRLITLNIDNHRLSTLPKGIGELKNLENLYLSAKVQRLMDFFQLNNSFGITSLPPEIGNCTKLTCLQLYYNRLTSLPAEIGRLIALESLIIALNQLTSLPPEIGKLRALERLHAFDNKLTSLPNEIKDLKALKELWIGDNRLTSLPPGIGELTELQQLRVQRNRLTSLPEEIDGLISLQELLARENQLNSLPEGFWRLSYLDRVLINDNPLETTLRNFVRGRGHYTITLDGVLLPESQTLYRANLLLLENGPANCADTNVVNCPLKINQEELENYPANIMLELHEELFKKHPNANNLHVQLYLDDNTSNPAADLGGVSSSTITDLFTGITSKNDKKIFVMRGGVPVLNEKQKTLTPTQVRGYEVAGRLMGLCIQRRRYKIGGIFAEHLFEALHFIDSRAAETNTLNDETLLNVFKALNGKEKVIAQLFNFLNEIPQDKVEEAKSVADFDESNDPSLIKNAIRSKLIEMAKNDLTIPFLFPITRGLILSCTALGRNWDQIRIAKSPQELEQAIQGMVISPLLVNKKLFVTKSENSLVSYEELHQIEKWLKEWTQEIPPQTLTNFIYLMTGKTRLAGVTLTANVYKTDGNYKENWPVFHTCFDNFEIPLYESKQMLDKQMRAGIDYTLREKFNMA